MGNVIRTLINFGCRSDQPRSISRTIRLTNGSALISCTSYLFFLLFYSFYDFHSLLPGLYLIAFGIPCSLATLLLNHEGRHLPASIVMNLSASVPVFLNLLLFFGSSIGHHYFFILFSLLPLFTIPGNRKILMPFLSFMNLALYLCLPDKALFMNLSLVLKPGIIAGFRWATMFMSFSGVIIVTFIYRQILHKSEAELEKRTEVLGDAYHLVNQLASLDSLTTIFNRRHLEKLIQEEIEHAAKNRAPLSMILFDLDHFKKVNDIHGHAVGDQVLKLVASMVGHIIRGTDSFGRWGGEEFIVILPQTTLNGAMQVAEKIRHTMDAEHLKNEIFVTGSFGVADWTRGESQEQFCKRVDLALYQAKDEGRNRVVAAMVIHPGTHNPQRFGDE